MKQRCRAFFLPEYVVAMADVEENDIIAVSRTGFDDGLGGAHKAHDANYFTFHRIKDFRKRTLDDPPLNQISGKERAQPSSRGDK